MLLELAYSFGTPRANEYKLWDRTMIATVIDFSQNLLSFHALPIPQHRSAGCLLCIGPLWITKSCYAILRVTSVRLKIE